MTSSHKNSSTIVINGRHYDAGTGELVSHGAPSSHAAADHRTVKHMAAHSPKSSQTLMRQSVNKPSDSLKRRIKVQGQLDSSAKRSSSKILVRSDARKPNLGRLQNPGTKRGKGHLISHFSPELFAVDSHTPAITFGAAPVKHVAAPHSQDTAPKTTADLLEYAAHHAEVPSQPKPHRRKLFSRHAAAKHHR